MEVQIKVLGAIATKREKIVCKLEVPENWNPSRYEFSKVLGTVRYLTQKLEQNFKPPAKYN